MSSPKEIILSISEAQTILNFLISCPYNQVHELVGYLANAKPVEENNEDKE